MPQKYRMKPVEIEAVQFCPNEACIKELTDWGLKVDLDMRNRNLPILRVKGRIATEGDYIVKEGGNFYPVRPDVFMQTYGKAEVQGLVWNRLILRLAETLAVTLKTLANNNSAFPNNEPLFRKTISLFENLLEDKDNPLRLSGKERDKLVEYYLEIAEAVSYGIIVKEYKKHAANR